MASCFGNIPQYNQIEITRTLQRRCVAFIQSFQIKWREDRVHDLYENLVLDLLF